jgi:ElaB/YqjD/DUF883 family membrane-anchored ribosome-binding protein
MNDPIHSNSEFTSEAESAVRMNPGSSLLVALGIGLIAGALIHFLRPAPTPQQRLARLVEDIEDRLRDVAKPALNKASDMAMDGAEALSGRLHRGEAQVEKLLRGATRRLRQLVP